MIANSNYDTLPRLNAAVTDARELARRLPMALQSDRTVVAPVVEEDLRSHTFPAALSRFLDVLDDSVACYTDVLVFVHFSGHGWDDGIHQYMMMADIGTAKGVAVCVPLKHVINDVCERLRRHTAVLSATVVCSFDACRQQPPKALQLHREFLQLQTVDSGVGGAPR